MELFSLRGKNSVVLLLLSRAVIVPPVLVALCEVALTADQDAFESR